MNPPIAPFKLERYFAQYEFSAPYLLSPSDCESLTLREVLDLADAETQAMWQELSLGYTESSGHPALRLEASRLYTSIRPEEILVLTPEEGIFIAMHSLLSPGDEVVVISPAYQSLHEIARSIGCIVRPWPLLKAEQGWQLDLPGLKERLSSKTRLLVLNFPHNPTGYLPPRTELDAILALARDYNLWVFSDEMYRLLEYAPDRRLPAVCDLYERAISLAGMSKVFALPGLRIGWLASRNPGLMERWITLKDYTTICSSAPSEILALMALRAGQAILARNLGIIQANLKTAEAFFAGHPGLFSWLPPQAGSVAFPEWRGSDSVEAFCQSLVEQQGVMLVPGSLFDAPGSHFRLGLGRRNFGAALERLAAYLQAGS